MLVLFLLLLNFEFTEYIASRFLRMTILQLLLMQNIVLGILIRLHVICIHKAIFLILKMHFIDLKVEIGIPLEIQRVDFQLRLLLVYAWTQRF